MKTEYIKMLSKGLWSPNLAKIQWPSLSSPPKKHHSISRSMIIMLSLVKSLRRPKKFKNSIKLSEVKCQEIGCAPTAKEIQGNNANGQKHQKEPELTIEERNNPWTIETLLVLSQCTMDWWNKKKTKGMRHKTLERLKLWSTQILQKVKSQCTEINFGQICQMTFYPCLLIDTNLIILR